MYEAMNNIKTTFDILLNGHYYLLDKLEGKTVRVGVNKRDFYQLMKELYALINRYDEGLENNEPDWFLLMLMSCIFENTLKSFLVKKQFVNIMKEFIKEDPIDFIVRLRSNVEKLLESLRKAPYAITIDLNDLEDIKINPYDVKDIESVTLPVGHAIKIVYQSVVEDELGDVFTLEKLVEFFGANSKE